MRVAKYEVSDSPGGDATSHCNAAHEMCAWRGALSAWCSALCAFLPTVAVATAGKRTTPMLQPSGQIGIARSHVMCPTPGAPPLTALPRWRPHTWRSRASQR